jgi:hypothetical protein
MVLIPLSISYIKSYVTQKLLDTKCNFVLSLKKQPVGFTDDQLNWQELIRETHKEKVDCQNVLPLCECRSFVEQTFLAAFSRAVWVLAETIKPLMGGLNE